LIFCISLLPVAASADTLRPQQTVTVDFRLVGDTAHGIAEAPQYADWIAARQVVLEGEGPFTVYDVFMKAIGEAVGLTQTGAEGNYVKSITKDGLTLGEFTNGIGSGWMYTLNGVHSGFGLKEQSVKVGDSVVWHYVNHYTVEEGAWEDALAREDDAPGKPVPEGIELTGPRTLSYTVGDRFSSAGLAVEVKFAGGYRAQTGYYGLSVEDGEVLREAGERTVTVTYMGKSAAFTVTVAPASYQAALPRALSYLRAGVPAPGFGTLGGEWSVLALARSGHAEPDYYNAYYRRVFAAIDGKAKLDARVSTDNSRAVLALTALGLNAADIGGNDLVSALADMAWVKGQGINGPIWALIALDTKGYLPQVARAPYKEEILAAETGAGGWGLSPGEPDPDITSMALQALAPYRDEPDVRAATSRALAWLSGAQGENGTFPSAWGADSSESVAQAIIALSALGIDADRDARFVKNGTGLVGALLSYADAGGGFRHVPGGAVDAMATDQAALALIAYDRYIRGAKRLYDMSNAERLVTDTSVGGDEEKDEEAKEEAKQDAPLTPPETPAPPIALSDLSIRIADVPWTGKNVTSGLTVTASYGSPARTVELTPGDYTLAKAGTWYKNIGKATITLKAKGAKYTGEKTVSFRIVPRKLTLGKVSAGKRSVKAAWKKAAAAQKITGYQIRYRLKSSAKWSPVKNVPGKKLTCKIGKLKKGKRYYVHVRAYKKVGKVKYYGPWSEAKLSKAVK
jgi:hypothetical protein